MPDSEWEPNDEVLILTLFLVNRDGSPTDPYRVVVADENDPLIHSYIDSFNKSEMFAVGSWNLKMYAPKPF